MFLKNIIDAVDVVVYELNIGARLQVAFSARSIIRALYFATCEYNRETMVRV